MGSDDAVNHGQAQSRSLADVLGCKERQEDLFLEFLAHAFARVGDGGRAEFQVKVGDRILFSSYAGTEIKVAGEEYLILAEDDVLAVVD